MLAVLLVASGVSAFAISSPYWNDNPLNISPGESKNFFIVLNNGAGAVEDMRVQCKIAEGGDIAVISGSGIYDVPAGGKVSADLSVQIPAGMSVGMSRTVKLSCSPIGTGNGSGAPVMLAQAIEQIFPVNVVEQQIVPVAESSGSNMWIYVVVGVIIVILLLVLVLGRKK